MSSISTLHFNFLSAQKSCGAFVAIHLWDNKKLIGVIHSFDEEVILLILKNGIVPVYIHGIAFIGQHHYSLDWPPL